MGEVFKKSWDCFPDIYAKWSLHEEDIPYPGGENGAALWNRCKDELFKIAASGYERVAIVTHGGIVRAALCGILGLPQEKRFCFGVPTINCSISILSYYDSKFYIHTFNDYSHIQ
jgi:probable phosphoglycerate mutase